MEQWTPDYILEYRSDDERRSQVAYAEGQYHVILHDNHYWKDTVDADGERTRVLDYGELVVYKVDPRPQPVSLAGDLFWDDAASVDEKLDLLARYTGLKKVKVKTLA